MGTGAQACGCDVVISAEDVLADDPDATVKRVQTDALNGQVRACATSKVRYRLLLISVETNYGFRV